MDGVLRMLPSLPRGIPEITCGATASGSEVVDCRVQVLPTGSPALSVVRADGDGVRTVGVPSAPSPLSDFLAQGEDSRLSDDGWRTAGQLLIREITAMVEVHPVKAKRHLVQVRVPASTTRRHLRNLAQGLVTAGRVPTVRHRSPAPTVRDIHIDLTGVPDQVADAAPRELALGAALGGATALARDLDSLPDGAVSVEWWRQTAKDITAGIPGLRTRVRGINWLERKGFRGLLSICGDPVRYAGLVEFTWDPAAAEGELTDMRPDAVLVGGAVVPAALRALADLRSPRKIVGLVPVTGLPVAPQPVPSGRPAEIVEHCGGLTTSVNASGDEDARTRLARRIAAADALAHGSHRYRPAQIIAVGAWTAAAETALGTGTGALFTRDADRARRMTLRGAKVGERWWPMPMPSYLEDAVDAESTDLTAEPAGPAAPAAALYFDRFTGDSEFTSLDIGGPSSAPDGRGSGGRVATGFAARSLVEWFRR